MGMLIVLTVFQSPKDDNPAFMPLGFSTFPLSASGSDYLLLKFLPFLACVINQTKVENINIRNFVRVETCWNVLKRFVKRFPLTVGPQTRPERKPKLRLDHINVLMLKVARNVAPCLHVERGGGRFENLTVLYQTQWKLTSKPLII